MIFTYLAVINGGIGPDVWDKEVEVAGPNMTIMQALTKIELELSGDGVVVSIEQID